MILIYVQHLLGTGHLQRIRLIAEELLYQHCTVTVISGGMPHALLDLPGLNLVQLEPVRSNGFDFTTLLDRDGQPVTEEIMTGRRNKLLESYDAASPDILILETFPFGRRPFRHELLALLQRNAEGKVPATVISSIRDVLQIRKDKRQLETLEWVEQYFDHILVHGDEGFLPLDESFSYTRVLGEKLHYTGYIAPAPVPRVLDHVGAQGEILVSAGGGAAGMALYQAAMVCALECPSSLGWRFLIGHGVSDSAFQALQNGLPPQIIVERNRPDFRELLAECCMLISQAGYNTVMDVLVTGAPALLVPFEGEAETEQLMRARKLQQDGRIVMLREIDLNTENLVAAIEKVRSADAPALPALDLAGVQNSADFVLDLLRHHPEA